MTAVNNFDLIRPLLKWENTGDYYYVQLILRKKDGATTFGNKNNSARLIKTYCFFNMEQFNQKEEEIIALCENRGCRAGINFNKRNEELVTYVLLEQLAKRIRSKNFRGINGIINTTNGAKIKSEDDGEAEEEEVDDKYNGSKDKIWLIDCDTKEEYDLALEILADENLLPVGEKILTTLPTYTGWHLITTPFNRMRFDKAFHQKLGYVIDIHKNNPAALYYPDKNVSRS